jgi:hypothetical protein
MPLKIFAFLIAAFMTFATAQQRQQTTVMNYLRGDDYVGISYSWRIPG